MRRKLAIGAIILFSLVLLVVVAVMVYVRSGRLDNYLRSEVIAAFADSGIRAEIASSSLDLRGYKVTLRDITLYTPKNAAPLAVIDSVTAVFSVTSYLKQRIQITHLEVVHPQISITVDKQARFSFEGIHAPPERKTKDSGDVAFLTATIGVTQAEVTYTDLRREISAHIAGLDATLTPKDPASLRDELNHTLELAMNNATVSYEGREIRNIISRLRASLTDKNAEVQEFELSSDLGRIAAAFNISSFEPFKYESTKDVHAEVDLDKIAHFFLPGTQLAGKVTFNGKVDGTGADYHVQGGVEAARLTADGFTVAGLHLKTKLAGSGDEYHASADLTSGPVTGRGLKISSIGVKDASVKGESDRFDIRGALKLAALESGSITLNGLSGQLFADQRRIGLAQFTAGVLGGKVSGAASVDYMRGPSKVDLQFNSIALDQAATLAAAQKVKIGGTAQGDVHLQFPGFNYKAATGRINASFDATLAPADSDAAPESAKGELVLAANGRTFEIERATIESVKSELSVTGSMGWDGLASLAVHFKSTDMADVQRVADSFGLMPSDLIEQHPVALSGGGQFEGRFEGHLDDPSVTGRLSLEKIELPRTNAVSLDKPADQDKPVEAGAFQGDISYSRSMVRVENASLVRSDGSRADFSVIAPLDLKDSIAVHANLQNFDMAMLVQAALPTATALVTNGAVSGTIDLKGLPGPRTIEGSAKVTINSAEFNLPSSEEDQDTNKVSVPEFAGDVTFANSIVSVANMRLKVGDADISGEGTFNLDTYAYSVNAGGRNIDLAALSKKLSGPEMNGVADVTIKGDGKWGKDDDWSEVNLNALISGRDVMIEGREVGDAKIVAFTENGVMKVEASGKLLDQPRSLVATINLRDRDNYPIESSIEFTDEDIGPYLGLVAPQLANISGRATGRIKLSGPLQRTDELKVIATLSKLEFGGAITDRLRYTIANQSDVVVTGTLNELTVEPVTFVGEGTSVKLGGALARESSSNSKLGINGEVNLRLLSSFTEAAFTTGIARVQAQIGGSLQSPELLGVMTLEDAGVRLLNFPLVVSHGNGQIRFTANQALVEDFKATTPGGGSIAIAGGAALSGLIPDAWRLEIKADQIAGEYPRDTETTMDANLVLQGKRGFQQVLSGHAEVRRAAYTRNTSVEELIRTGGGPFSPEALEAGPGGSGTTSALPTVLDLRITADNTLIIKNNLADAVGSAFLNMRGSIDNPQVSGRLLLNQGTLEFRNGRYDINRGMITLPPQRRAEPIFDFQTEASISGYRIAIAFSGPLAKLHTSVTSDPQLPERDIVNLILTGSISSDQSNTASVGQTGLGLAQAILSASLSEQLEKGTQRLFGLSRFSIDPLLVGRGTDPTARITLGQRITKDLTVTYSQNLTSGVSGIEQVVLVEYRLSNRYSIVGSRNEQGQLGFDFRLHKRF